MTQITLNLINAQNPSRTQSKICSLIHCKQHSNYWTFTFNKYMVIKHAVCDILVNSITYFRFKKIGENFHFHIKHFLNENHREITTWMRKISNDDMLSFNCRKWYYRRMKPQKLFQVRNWFITQLTRLCELKCVNPYLFLKNDLDLSQKFRSYDLYYI